MKKARSVRAFLFGRLFLPLPWLIQFYKCPSDGRYVKAIHDQLPIVEDDHWHDIAMQLVAPFPVCLRVAADVPFGECNLLLGKETLHPVAVASPLSHVECHVRLCSDDTAGVVSNHFGG